MYFITSFFPLGPCGFSTREASERPEIRRWEGKETIVLIPCFVPSRCHKSAPSLQIRPQLQPGSPLHVIQNPPFQVQGTGPCPHVFGNKEGKGLSLLLVLGACTLPPGFPTPAHTFINSPYYDILFSLLSPSRSPTDRGRQYNKGEKGQL